MKRARKWVGTGVVLGGSLWMSSWGCAGTEPGQEGAEVWLQQLKDEEYRVRQQATMKLWEMGEQALPMLKRGMQSEEPEVVKRVRDLEHKIKLSIRPDTPELVRNLVEKYDGATAEERRMILQQLVQEKAWYQALKLASLPDQAEVAKKLVFSREQIALQGARQWMLAGRDQEALTLLELMPESTSKWVAVGEWYRIHGRLDEEITKARGDLRPEAVKKLMGFLRVKGDLVEVSKVARLVGEVGYANFLDLLHGKPSAWLKSQAVYDGWMQDVPKWDREDEDEEAGGGVGMSGTTPSKSYMRLAEMRWNGERMSKEDMDEILKKAKSKNKAISLPAMDELAALGEHQQVGELYRKSQPMEAFVYHDSMDQVEQALLDLGLDADGGGLDRVLKELFARYLANEEEGFGNGKEDGTDLLRIANFYERRGMDEELWKAVSPYMKDLQEKKIVHFHMWVSKMLQIGPMGAVADGLGERLILDWIGGKEERCDEAVDAVLGENDEIKSLWELVQKAGVGESKIACFKGLLAVKSLGVYQESYRKEWFSKLWKEVDQRVGDEKIAALRILMGLGGELGEVELALKAWDQIPKASRGENEWTQIMFHLSAAGRWDDCYALVHEKMEQVVKNAGVESPAMYSYVAAALRKCGKEAEAKEYDQKVERLVLGDSENALLVSQGYEFGMDYERAKLWVTRAVAYSVAGTYHMSRVLEVYSELLGHEKRWKELASVNEYLIARGLNDTSMNQKFLSMVQDRLKADIARGLSRVGEDRAGAVKILGEVHRNYWSHGVLADLLYPNLAELGLDQELDAWFQESWKGLKATSEKYPNSVQIKNTMSWMAARAKRRLGEAEELMQSVIKRYPRQGAYIDTLAEVCFAKGEKQRALTYSKESILYLPTDRSLIRQHDRFLKGVSK